VDMCAGKREFVVFWETVRYHLQKRGDRPTGGGFTYAEKAEYWALVWGSVVMALTGFVLWFDNMVIRYMPRGVLRG